MIYFAPMKTKNVIIVCALALVAGCAGLFGLGGRDATVGLKVNHLSAPANVAAVPVFSWKMESGRTGARQTAYRIEVREDAPDGAVAWDSGPVGSGVSVGVKYEGKPLKSARRYFWTVTVRDDRYEWLEPGRGFFETGLIAKEDWNGSQWISAAGSKVSAYPGGHDSRNVKQEAEDGTSCFVKSIANGKEVKEAFWTVTGLGVFEAYVNGKPVSRFCKCTGKTCRDFLKPGFTHYGKTKHAFTYDVTHLMKTGAADANTFAAQVSAGWWRDKIVNFAGKKSAFRAQLILRHADGTETRVGTDTTWLSALAGPVIRAAIFDGEDYDARIKNGWMTAAAPEGFKASEINTEFKGGIFPMEGAPVALRCDLAIAPAEMYVWKGVEGAKKDEFGTVKKVRSYSDGDSIELDAGETLIVDFAQNAAAVPAFEFAAAAGTTLTMRPAEMLNDGNGAKKRGCDGPEGSIYTTNYRKARTTLNYTFAGEGMEKYHPEFTFFGYRYASITTTDKVKIAKIRSIPVTSIRKQTETGRLTTGVADVNRLIANVQWGQYSNYLSVPTDCPQRNERLGWTADTQVFAHAGSFNADTSRFFHKWMRDMRDSQDARGGFPGVAPHAQYGNEPMRFGWADAGVIVPYQIWKQFGDVKIIEENWAAMCKYVDRCAETKYDFEATRGENGGYQWADWLSYEGVPGNEKAQYWNYLGACYWLWDARLMVEMGHAAGKDTAKYAKQAVEAKAFIKAAFFTADGTFKLATLNRMQTPALFALKLGLVEGAAKDRMIAGLRTNVKDHGDCLQTGFLGTSILMETLSENGMTDVAYTLLLQHKNPSWLYSVDQGATTIWERWNSYRKDTGFGDVGMNSFNHYAYGAVLSWIYKVAAGIAADPKAPGFKNVVMAPQPDRRLGHVNASYKTRFGEVKSAWRYEGDTWVWDFTVPKGATASVTLPGEKQARTYAPGTYHETVKGL